MSMALRVLAITGCAVLACGDSISNNHLPANPKPPPGKVWSYDYYSYVDEPPAQVWSYDYYSYVDAPPSKKKWSENSHSYVYYNTCSGETQTCGPAANTECYQDECCQDGQCIKPGGSNCSPQHSYNKNKGCPENAMRQLVEGETLVNGVSLTSPNEHVRLVMQSGGNLVMYERNQAGESKPIWSSNTGGNPGAGLIFQRNGCLVIKVKGGSAIHAKNNRWKSTSASTGVRLLMGDDCDLRMFDSAWKLKWHLGTHCKFPTLGNHTLGETVV